MGGIGNSGAFPRCDGYRKDVKLRAGSCLWIGEGHSIGGQGIGGHGMDMRLGHGLACFWTAHQRRAKLGVVSIYRYLRRRWQNKDAPLRRLTCRQYISPYFPTVSCQSTGGNECVAARLSAVGEELSAEDRAGLTISCTWPCLSNSCRAKRRVSSRVLGSLILRVLRRMVR